MTTVRINESFAAKAEHSSVTVQAETLEVELDESKLGRGPARALRDAVAAGIKGITELANKATIAARRRHGSASTRLFNDSGHLANAIELREDRDHTFEIAAPADRFASSRFPEIAELIAKLRELVPALRGPLDVASVRAAIEQSVRDMIKRIR